MGPGHFLSNGCKRFVNFAVKFKIALKHFNCQASTLVFLGNDGSGDRQPPIMRNTPLFAYFWHRLVWAQRLVVDRVIELDKLVNTALCRPSDRPSIGQFLHPVGQLAPDERLIIRGRFLTVKKLLVFYPEFIQRFILKFHDFMQFCLFHKCLHFLSVQ